MTDRELLSKFHAARDQEAFAELVRRHADLVYATARRQVPDAAEDVMQAVFLLLSRKARHLTGHENLAGWLYRVTRYCCRNVQRGNQTRQHHEREAGMRQAQTEIAPPASAPAELTALLDAGLDRLRTAERDAVLLRYLQQKTLAETGAALSIGEEAAKKRAQRGLDKLRTYFATRGFAVPSTAVVGVLTGAALLKAPASAVAATATVASGAAGASTAVAAIAKGAAAMITWAAMQTAIVVTAGAIVVGVGVIVVAAGPEKGGQIAATTRAAATRPAFTLGHDTTRITAPLLPDGRPDYVTYMDQILRKGVTPENNAAVGLFEVFGTGPNVIPEKIHAEALKRLGITKEQARAFQYYWQYLKKQDIKYDATKQDEETVARTHPWGADEFPDIARWLVENDNALDRIAKAVGRDRYYWPWIVTTDRGAMMNALLPSLGTSREAANALTTRAMLRLDKGQIRESQADLIAVHRLGRLLSQQPTPIEKLVGVAIENVAAHADVELADGLKPDAAKAYLAELAKLPPMSEVVASVEVAERFTVLDAALSMAKYGVNALDFVAYNDNPSPPTGDWDTTNVHWDTVLKQINGEYDDLVVAMRKPTHAERLASLAAFGKHIQERKAAALAAKDPTERITGVVMILIPSLGQARELADRAQERTDLGMLAIALAAYRGDKGTYPDKLEDLSPAYLKTIPKDLFADAPLKYRKEGQGYLLYSIGPDLKDDNGTPGKTDATGDIVVRMFK